MSETTSPNVTIFPKASSRPVSRSLVAYLAESPYLLVRVSSLPQRCNDVAFEVRDVARDQAGLAAFVGRPPPLPDHRRQHARLARPERLGPALVLDERRAAHVGEREATVRVGR